MLNTTEDNEAIKVWDTHVRNHSQPVKGYNLHTAIVKSHQEIFR